MSIFLWRLGFVAAALAVLALAGWLVEVHDRRVARRRAAVRAHTALVRRGEQL